MGSRSNPLGLRFNIKSQLNIYFSQHLKLVIIFIITNTLIENIDTYRLRVVNRIDIIGWDIEEAILIQDLLINDARVLIEAIVADIRY